VTFTADLGQGEELEPARAKAELMGVKQNIFIDDLREEFVRDFVAPMMRSNARVRRPVSARHLDRAAADRQAARRNRLRWGRRCRRPRRHRQGQRPGPLRAFGLCAQPDIRVIAPWREWDLTSRTRPDRLRRTAPDPSCQGQARRSPFSVDANLLHTSSEGKVLEDPWEEAPDYVYSAPTTPRTAPDTPEYIDHRLRARRRGLRERRGLSPAALLTRLNELGGCTASAGWTSWRTASSA
jgi:argininosuccinate synthase